MEILSSLLIVWILVWVLEKCEFSVSLLDLFSCGSLGEAQNVIENEPFLLVTSNVVSEASLSFFDFFFLFLTIGFKAIVFLFLLLLVFASGLFVHFN